MKTPAQKRKDKKKSHIPFRLNLLFFLVFLMFASLILRLGYLQIIRADDYQAEVERTERTTITGSVPRGEIFDANLRKLVGNEARHAITYTRGRNVPAGQMAEVAYDLAEFIEMPSVPFFAVDSGSDVSRRDLQDYYIAQNQEEVRERLDDEDLSLGGPESYQAMLDTISDEDLEQLSERDLTAAAIFKQMNAAFALSTVNVKNEDVTQEEIARVSENLDALPGIGTGTDWVREYPQEDMLRSIVGRVSSEQTGVPAGELRSFLARGYSRNDRVGQTYLEEEYESVLRGTKSRLETETNSSGDIINQIEQYSGQKGDNLILTIDIDFQEKVEQIALDSLEEREGVSDSVYIMAMNPQNGDVLAMAGKEIGEDGEVRDNALGNITGAYEVGSSIKGATVLAASMDGVLDDSNNDIYDTPIRISGSRDIRSLFNYGGNNSVWMDEIDAIERSSNVYMAKLAMRMGGVWDHQQGSALNINSSQLTDRQRYYFSQFGLGVLTGIDLPNETTGLQSQASDPGQPLFNSFGQFDTYTNIQLAQHISTIANGGTRIAPRMVSEIRGTDPETGRVGALKTEIKPKILNHLDVDSEMLENVHEGLYRVNNGTQGTARSAFSDAPYSSAGKTGTAQANHPSGTVTNLTYVGFAPFDNPEIAVSVIVPYLPLDSSERSNRENIFAARRVFDAYFNEGEFSETEEIQDVESIEELEDIIEEEEE